jgi:hypothetical protein
MIWKRAWQMDYEDPLMVVKEALAANVHSLV